jgi:hypothetical protein
MANSQRMRWPYPAQGTDPWYDQFERLISSQDASAFAIREASNVILAGGGLISWNAGTGTLSWANSISLNSSASGYLESIPAGSVSVPNDGDFGLVLFVSSPQDNVTLQVLVASKLPASEIDRPFVLFRRRGSKIFWRNGGVLDDGDSKAVIDDGPGGGGGGANSLQDAYDGGQSIVLSSGDLDILPDGTSNVNISANEVNLVGAAGVSITGDTDVDGYVSATGYVRLGQVPTVSLPTPAPAGGLIYDSTTNEPKWGNGTVWSPFTSGGGAATFILPVGETIAVGELVAVNGSGNAILADSTVVGRFPAIGVCTAVGVGVIDVLPVGAATVFSGLTPGTTYFVGTSGGLSATPPMGAIVSQPAVVAYSATSGVLLTTNAPVVLVP